MVSFSKQSSPDSIFYLLLEHESRKILHMVSCSFKKSMPSSSTILGIKMKPGCSTMNNILVEFNLSLFWPIKCLTTFKLWIRIRIKPFITSQFWGEDVSLANWKFNLLLLIQIWLNQQRAPIASFNTGGRWQCLHLNLVLGSGIDLTMARDNNLLHLQIISPLLWCHIYPVTNCLITPGTDLWSI